MTILCLLLFSISCSGRVPYITADDYGKYLNETLAKIHANIPKVFVNVILAGNLSEVPMYRSLKKFN